MQHLSTKYITYLTNSGRGYSRDANMTINSKNSTNRDKNYHWQTEGALVTKLPLARLCTIHFNLHSVTKLQHLGKEVEEDMKVSIKYQQPNVCACHSQFQQILCKNINGKHFFTVFKLLDHFSQCWAHNLSHQKHYQHKRKEHPGT